MTRFRPKAGAVCPQMAQMAQITKPVAAEGFLPARRVHFHALDASKCLPICGICAICG